MSKNAYLKAMGIDVWVERMPTDSTVIEPNITNKKIPLVSKPSTTSIPETPNKNAADELKSSVVDTVEEIDIESLDWQELFKQASSCKKCELSKTRTQTLFGEGNQNADLFFIGDDSDQQSATLLTAMLKAMGYQRNDIYISNIVKCHSLEQQDPSDEQADSCHTYLMRQISLVKPKLIVALGNAAAQHLLKNKSTMNRLRGQLHYVDGINSPILVTYHPTYLLASPNEKRKTWEDLQLAMKEIEK